MDKPTRRLRIGDEVILRDHPRLVHSTGTILNIIPVGYEVKLAGVNRIIYENDDTIELRFPDDHETS